MRIARLVERARDAGLGGSAAARVRGFAVKSADAMGRTMPDKADLVHVEIFGQTYAVKAGADPALRREAGRLRRRADEGRRAARAAPSTPCASRCSPRSTSPTSASGCAGRRRRRDAPRGAAPARDERVGAARADARGRARRVASRDRLARARERRLSSALEALCDARDGYGNLEPTSLIRGSDSPRGEHASASRKPEARLRTPTW